MKEVEVDKKQQIISAYLEVVSKKKDLPSRSDLLDFGITNDSVRQQFGNLQRLHDLIEEEYHDELNKHITSQAYVFSERNLRDLDDSLKSYKRFVVTTAVAGKAVDLQFYEAIRTYCEQKNAKLLIIPSADIASRNTKVKWAFDENLHDEVFITEETRLNDSIFISNIHVSAKQIKPTTGLGRIGQRNGSYIFASPKQFLEYVATSPAKDRLPKALMTTGAVTIADYNTDRFMAQRTSYIAESDHVIGGLIVEIVDDKLYHFRQIQARSDGSFADLGVRYYGDPTLTQREKVDFYAGDWHSGETDPDVAMAALTMCKQLEVTNFYTGDFFTGRSITHHDNAKPLKKAKKAYLGINDLVEELQLGVADIVWILEHIKGKVHLLKGNHDEILERYLYESRYVNDPQNHYVSLQMAADLLDDKNPLAEAYKRHAPDDIDPVDWHRVVFIERDEETRIGPVEAGQHGDLGPNGSQASLQGLENAYGLCVVGHAHTAAIFRGVYRVGTFTKLQLDYNVGPSSWTHTGCLIYPDGSRQLINFINGQYCA